MRIDARDEDLAAVLDRAVEHIEPDPGRPLARIRRRGTAKRAARWTATAAGLAIFVGALGWAAAQVPALRVKPGGGSSDRQVRSLRVDVPWARATLTLPPGWVGGSAASDQLAVVDAATLGDAIVSGTVIHGCRPGEAACAIIPLNLTKLGPSDAYVQVWAVYAPAIGHPWGPIEHGLPFTQSGSWQGAPVMERIATGDDHGTYTITYWIGPQAGPEIRGQVDAILAGLHLPPSVSPSPSGP